MQVGDRVALNGLGPAGDAPVGVVKSISAGGTVTLKAALDGQRCFPMEALCVVLNVTFAGPCATCQVEVTLTLTLHDCRNPQDTHSEWNYPACPNCGAVGQPRMVRR